MKPEDIEALPGLLDVLGYDEEPLGIFYTDRQPEQGISPKPLPGLLPTREKELSDQIDWRTIWKNFSCVISFVWRVRKKKTAAYFDFERFGCPGAAFFLGYLKPQTEMIVHYVSTGIPGKMEGELYFPSPEECRAFQQNLDPSAAPKRYCVIKQLSLFSEEETPDLVAFFCRPESLCGLHQLTRFITKDNEAVRSPMGSACASLVSWPYYYLRRGENKAVLGGWDPSARKFFKTDELGFTVPWAMFLDLLGQWDRSFLTTKTWQGVRKRIAKSRQAWGRAVGDT
jgi:uncharacterized protein (DUF169 family)